MKVRCFAVVPAAGSGKRMGAAVPKQYLELLGRPVLQHTLERLLAVAAVERVVVALAADDPRWPALLAASDPRVMTTIGGAERGDSVLAGLRALAAEAGPDDWVMVHDAARPCLRPDDVEKLLAELKGDPVGGILALPSVDTLKEVEGRDIVATVDRSRIWRALTPQLFRYRLLTEALERALAAGATITDEASAVEWAGRRPKIVEGHPGNIKITRPEDLPLAEFYLRQ
ncbi:2-C-methyl-D-erythritol 4-phosphate cytidylyltransferase [Methylomarinovum caldicuralii]|uniref:2-C-methyl-D-erythritol 4-phosphate cytidylyltransferase n=1 Tax=Methylomarinovum caldicuralii TaxID=438856 RepID=A0AAU9C3M8_9GAMM|nr:2-C-methyl-D-erythritol 4-phosphate cytidylyltransferase [Methylomarinovum caldicuralii]BCX82288.1 2-C-methyl-D-erythritol 4-phosphate cytidylyltransferase [Methylomarinovum caldicuralii]